MMWLEKYLTRVPMYLLIAGSLFALVAFAFIASLFGAAPFGPLALVVSALVFALTSTIVSFLLGKLYGVPSHLPSALITALILTLLFTPSLEFASLLQFALIAAIAQASKYVVTFASRHIFNPAAFGAFAGGLLQLQFASWWVSTPTFAVLVAVTGFLILYKTRQLLLGGVFLFVALTLLGLNGVPPWLALTSWPLLFLVGFMLSEPLTLPPRKWQRLVVGVVVALLVSLPFRIENVFYSSPEFALLAGNMVAFILAFRQRKDLRLTLKGRRPLTPTTDEFIFTSPETLQFEAGQYVELTLIGGKTDNRGFRRSFSITNSPGSHELRLGIKFASPSSTFKQTLCNLPVGASVQSTGIYGDFVLPKGPAQKLLFIAGGIGITPFMSHIVASAGEGRDIVLLYFVRTPEEAAYADILNKSPITVHYFAGDDATGEFHEASLLTPELLARFVPQANTRTAYISGPPAMVTAGKAVLRGKVRAIKTDYFGGY